MLVIFTFVSALMLSVIAGYYSVVGLALIFPGAFWPVVFMGSVLEASKLVTASWLYRNWSTAPRLLKYYLTTAVLLLMLITSMGIFGFLSKAHIEHFTESSPVTEKVAIYDEKIDLLKQQIIENKTAIQQMDESVSQVLSRSTSEKSALRSVEIRRSQQKERNRLTNENSRLQTEISKLIEEKTPLMVQLRKTEADFGPIKYVAELIYGSSETDIIDKAVRLVIMIIMLVFDPLAVLLLISANISMRQKDESDSLVPETKTVRISNGSVENGVVAPKKKQTKKTKTKAVKEVPEDNITKIETKDEDIFFIHDKRTE